MTRTTINIKIITIMMIISVRSSGKYAGSVMAVEVVKERTIETRQDVSFIRQPAP